MCMCLHIPSASFLCDKWPLCKLFSVTLFSTYQHTPLLCAQCPAHPVNHVCPVNTHCVVQHTALQWSWFLPLCIALFNQCSCVVYTAQPVNGWTPFISAQQQESPYPPTQYPCNSIACATLNNCANHIAQLFTTIGKDTQPTRTQSRYNLIHWSVKKNISFVTYYALQGFCSHSQTEWTSYV